MSIRAHRINELVYKDEATFNVWNDEGLVEFLRKRGVEFHEGTIDIGVDDLEAAHDELELEDSIRDAIMEDIIWANEKGEGYVLYDCF